MTKYIDSEGTFEVPEGSTLRRELTIRRMVATGMSREMAENIVERRLHADGFPNTVIFDPPVDQPTDADLLRGVRAYVQTQRDRLHLRYAITLADQTEDGEDYTRNFIDADEVDTVLANILRAIEGEK